MRLSCSSCKFLSLNTLSFELLWQSIIPPSHRIYIRQCPINPFSTFVGFGCWVNKVLKEKEKTRCRLFSLSSRYLLDLAVSKDLFVIILPKVYLFKPHLRREQTLVDERMYFWVKNWSNWIRWTQTNQVHFPKNALFPHCVFSDCHPFELVNILKIGTTLSRWEPPWGPKRH